MKLVYRYDEKFDLVASVILETDEFGNYIIPENCTTIAPPDNPSLYKPRFDPKKEEWFESATQEYIDSLQPRPSQPDDVTMLKKQVALLTLQLSQLQRGGAL
ncbi:hypothetical protein [Bacillus pumilus]|uniref:hypothetical protein n=1 Tax=Bacillus pumilus TaxID=1408 RepID=UPI0011A29F57|nr:hypothetical protein [Bacillus pumilus]